MEVPVEGQLRERLETRWQIMMFAVGRVVPAIRGRQSCRTNDRSRPTARRNSSGRARGSRTSNKPCPRASLLHRAPNVLENCPSGKLCWCLHREVNLKVRRTIFLHGFTVQAPASHSSFLTWLIVFGAVVRWLTWQGRVVRVARHGARQAGGRALCLELIQRQLQTPRPAGRRLR